MIQDFLKPSVFALLLAVAMTGCATRPLAEEDTARNRLTETSDALESAREQTSANALTTDSEPTDYLRFALLNHPSVEAAYHDWRASVEQITTSRSQPDPRITFQADIAERLMTFMPGVMFDVMNSGTQSAMGREAATASEVAYRNYLAQIQRTAVNFRKAWIELVYANEAIGLHTAMLDAFDEAAETAAADYITGSGMGSLEAQVRLGNEAAMHHSEHHATVYLVEAARARFKAALGLSANDSNPPWPAQHLQSTPIPTRDELWERIIATNPDLAVMRGMVDMAIAAEATAERSRSPNFSIGAMVDLKASPLMVRPLGGISLPIWRDKIAAEIAGAHARSDAALARVSAEELMLAAELAQIFFMVEEADVTIAYIDDVAIPNLTTTAETVAASYQSGMSAATMIAETQAMTYGMHVRRLDILRDRETTVADLLFLIGNAAPADITQLADNNS